MTNEYNIEAFKDYGTFLKEVKNHIKIAQVKANFAANRELIVLYWNIGRMVSNIQKSVGWGKKIIPRLARDIKNDLPEIKGFSVTNIKRMTQFYHEYNYFDLISPQAVGQLPSLPMEESKDSPQAVDHLVTGLPWGHNTLLIEKIKDIQKREWYMKQCIQYGWSRNVLEMHIQKRSYERNGNATTNFDRTLPPIHSDMAQQTLEALTCK